MKRRLLLIQPPFYRLHREDWSLDEVPLGLGYLAGVVREETDWEVAVYVADQGEVMGAPPGSRWLMGEGHRRFLDSLDDPRAEVWQEVRRVVEQVQPGVVGISVTSPLTASAKAVAKIVRSAVPDVVIVAGGAHASLDPLSLLDGGTADLCVIGEGEGTLPRLLEALDGGADGRGVEGVAGRDGSAVWIEPMPPPVDDLDGLPRPAGVLDDVLVHRERFGAEAFSSIITSRGCPHRCRYCGSESIWGRKVRRRSAGDVAAEVRGLRSRFGLDELVIRDDTFSLAGEGLQSLCGALHATDVQWSAQLHPSRVDAATVETMASAGCTMISLGLETGSDELLRALGKASTAAQGLEAARVVQAGGVRLLAYYMVGLPGESDQSLERTERLMRDAGAHLNVLSAFTPYPGTALFDDLQREGRIPADHDPGRISHTSPGRSYSPNLSDDQLQAATERLSGLADRLNRRGRVRYFARNPGRLIRRLLRGRRP